MFSFLKQIVDFISMVVKLVVLVVQSIFELITMIPQWVNFLVSSFANVPPVVLPFIVYGTVLSVILFFIGRSAGGGGSSD